MQFELKIENKEGWKGTVTLAVPTNSKRLVTLTKCKVQRLLTSKKIKALETEEEREDAGVKNLEILNDVYEGFRKNILAVDIKGPNGEEVKSLEALDLEDGLAYVFLDIANKFCEGFGPGKTKSP